MSGLIINPYALAVAGGAPAGPIPEFRAAGTVSGKNAGAANIDPGLPAGTAENDILVALVECNAGDTVPTPDGWTEAGGSPQSDATATETRLTVFWKRAGASEPDPVLITQVGDHTMGQILGFSGCATTGDPVNASDGASGAGGTVTIPGLATTVDNCLVVDAVAHGTDSAVGNRLSAWANASLADPGITEATDVGSSAGGGGGVAAAYGGKAAAGAVNDTTATLSTGNSWGAVKIALKP